MRKGVDGFAAIIFAKYGMDVFDDAIFLFYGDRKDWFKALYFDRDGFLLLYKRLENGRLQWPRDENEVKELGTDFPTAAVAPRRAGGLSAEVRKASRERSDYLNHFPLFVG
ncbi:MAG: IS66 family insertion sequence element accessory protein TnpB [Turicibacter sp.]|nr:IS66 family insertion sequence element accessory protein TnpB [Turicibacter sp.]